MRVVFEMSRTEQLCVLASLLSTPFVVCMYVARTAVLRDFAEFAACARYAEVILGLLNACSHQEWTIFSFSRGISGYARTKARRHDALILSVPPSLSTAVRVLNPPEKDIHLCRK